MQKPFLVLQKTLKINQTLSIDLERHSLHKHFSKTFFFHLYFCIFYIFLLRTPESEIKQYISLTGTVFDLLK